VVAQKHVQLRNETTSKFPLSQHQNTVSMENITTQSIGPVNDPTAMCAGHWEESLSLSHTHTHTLSLYLFHSLSRAGVCMANLAQRRGDTLHVRRT
jgi:hypothetical protein